MRRRVTSALALAAAAIAVVLVATGSSGTYRVTAVFEQAHGLVTGGDVQAGGLDVGKIEEITLGRDGLPRVTMEVADDYRLRRGATADLRLFSNSGELNRYVMLHQGKGPELADGATLGTTRTDQPVEFDQAISGLTPETREDVKAVLAGLDRGTRGRGADIDRTLRHSAEALAQVADLLDDVSSDGRALRTLFSEGRRVVGALASQPQDLGAFAERLAALLETTAGRQRELTATAELLAPGLRSPRVALDRFDRSIQNLRAFVSDARPATRELVPFSRDLRPALAAARPALREAERFTRAAPADLRALDPLLDTAVPSFNRLTSVLELANPILDHVRVRTPEVASTVTLWADMTANYDANGHGARTSVIVGNGPTNRLGPFDFGPGYVVRPFDRAPGVLEGEPWVGYEKSFIGGGRPVDGFLTAAERRSREGRAAR